MTVYQNKLVAFIDILGFSNLVSNSDNDPSKASLILSTLKELEDYIQKENSINEITETFNNHHKSKIKYTQFSDSIVLSADIIFNKVGYEEIGFIEIPDYNSLLILCRNIAFLQARLINKGVLIRGGLTWGQIYHENNICFGPAFIRAHKLECSLAKNPRIIIDPDLTDLSIIPTPYQSVKDYHIMMDMLKKEVFTIDENDNLYYINYFKVKSLRENIHSIQTKINEEAASLDYEKDKKILDKYRWLIDKINYIV